MECLDVRISCLYEVGESRMRSGSTIFKFVSYNAMMKRKNKTGAEKSGNPCRITLPECMRHKGTETHTHAQHYHPRS